MNPPEQPITPARRRAAARRRGWLRMAIGLAALQAARLATASAGTTGDVAWILCIGLAVTMLISALHAFQESRAR